MGRPITTGTTKQKLTLTVSPEVREYLEELSKAKKASISQILSEYATKEYKKLHKEK